MIKSLLAEAEFMELLVLWGILIGGPMSLWLRGREELKPPYPRKRLAAVLLIGAVIGAGVAITFLVFFGPELLKATFRAGGVWLIGLVIAAVICVIALPLSIVGQHLRAAREYSSAHHLKGGLLGLAIIALIAVICYFVRPVIGFAFALLALIAVTVGWFRHILVPDIEG